MGSHRKSYRDDFHFTKNRYGFVVHGCCASNYKRECICNCKSLHASETASWSETHGYHLAVFTKLSKKIEQVSKPIAIIFHQRLAYLKNVNFCY